MTQVLVRWESTSFHLPISDSQKVYASLPVPSRPLFVVVLSDNNVEAGGLAILWLYSEKGVLGALWVGYRHAMDWLTPDLYVFTQSHLFIPASLLQACIASQSSVIRYPIHSSFTQHLLLQTHIQWSKGKALFYRTNGKSSPSLNWNFHGMWKEVPIIRGFLPFGLSPLLCLPLAMVWNSWSVSSLWTEYRKKKKHVGK
jgi:hypothetical protein